jgi:prolyl oligopeptidase
MRALFLVPFAALSLVACPKKEPVAVVQAAATTLAYPAARRTDTVDSFYGTQVPDPYRWMEDLDGPELKTWIDAENQLTRAHLDAIPARAAIVDRLTKLWTYERWSTPVEAGGRTFFEYNDGTWDQARLFVVDKAGAEPRLLIDPATLSTDGTVALAQWEPSPDGKLVAWGIADAGSDWRTFKVVDAASGKVLPDEVQWGKFSDLAWTPDAAGFFYARYPAPAGQAMEEALANQSLWYHRLGTPQADDVLVYDDPAHPNRGYGAQVTDDGRKLILTVSEGTEEKYRVYVIELASMKLKQKGGRAGGAVNKALDAFDAAYVFVGNDGDTAYFVTDNGAPRYRLIAVDLKAPAADGWKELLPQTDATLEGVTYVGNRFVARYLDRASSRVEIHDKKGAMERLVELPGLGTATGFDGKISRSQTFFTFTSYTTPGTVYGYDVAKGTLTEWHAPAVDFDATAYVTDQVEYKTKDGTTVPMFITHRKDVALDGKNPTLLYGYGGFNIPLTPSFKVADLMWLELGGVYAVANLRGGGEFGRDWHEAGTKLRKQNVFDDFIAAAEHLIAQGWTNPSRLAIHGRSNGGLLVGAALTQRPDLFGAALPGVGVLDMLRYHKFTIGWAWASDYGTADESEEMFKALRAYSPVHNTKPGARYPSTLVLTADHDDRVVPLHSFKFAAALQHAQAGPDPVLIRVETRAGHGAGTPVSMLVEEVADRWAFLVDALAFTPGPGTGKPPEPEVPAEAPAEAPTTPPTP